MRACKFVPNYRSEPIKIYSSFLPTRDECLQKHRNMKTFCVYFILFAFLSVSLAEDAPDNKKPLREKCQKELGLTDEQVLAGENDPNSVKCYIQCYFKELGIVNEKGVYNPEVAVSVIEDHLRDAAKPAIYKCYEETKEFTDICQHAFDIVTCFKNALPEIYKKLGLFHPPQM